MEETLAWRQLAHFCAVKGLYAGGGERFETQKYVCMFKAVGAQK